MDKLSEKIMGMLDNRQSIFDISEYFGGIIPMLNQCKKYPELYRRIRNNLSGSMSCWTYDGESGEANSFHLPFFITSKDKDDDSHYHIGVNLLIPEITPTSDLQIIVTWLKEFLMDEGNEAGSYVDENLDNEMTWIYISHINGKRSNQFEMWKHPTDDEFMEVLPDKYFD
jgi:hypothetical protein